MDPFFAQIQARLRAFMRHSLSSEASEEDFNRLALDLFETQRVRNPAYASFCRGRGVEQPEDWRHIPAVPTAAFKQLEMTSLPETERARVFFSSGTTQQERSRHYHSEASLAVYEESLTLWFDHRFSPAFQDRRWIILTPPGTLAPNSSLAHMFHTLAARRLDAEFVGILDAQGGWQLNAAYLIDLLESAAQPVALFGTAFLFVHLLDELEASGRQLQLPADSWILETGGYKGRSREVSKTEFRQLLGAFLGLPSTHIFSEYGMSELSSQAYDRADGHFQFPPWARSVMISPATGRPVAPGERGLIRVVDLANIASVLAVQTEDVGMQMENGFELGGRAAQAEARGCSLLSV